MQYIEVRLRGEVSNYLQLTTNLSKLSKQTHIST